MTTSPGTTPPVAGDATPVSQDGPPPSSRDDARARRSRETVELFSRAATASPEDRDRIHEEIVCRHLPVARSVAARYRNRGVPQDDLEQIACTGLVLAVKRFDPELGESFLSFALPTIHGLVKRHFRDHGWVVRPPRRIQDLQSRISAARDELTQTLGRTPGTDEIAAHLGCEPSEIVEALVARGCFTPVSLDRPVGAPGDVRDTLGGLLAVLDQPHDAAEARLMVRPLVEGLSSRDKRIVVMRFFEERTQEEIGEAIGVSQIQVSRLLSRILRDLRRALTVPEEPSTVAS